VAGAVTGSAELIDRVRRTLNHYGGSLDPHTGFLLARGIKTLALRVRAQNDNATALASFLAGHPQIAGVAVLVVAAHPELRPQVPGARPYPVWSAFTDKPRLLDEL
jgi:cystathionine beta-lyase/cystathionine gamma-synthase